MSRIGKLAKQALDEPTPLGWAVFGAIGGCAWGVFCVCFLSNRGPAFVAAALVLIVILAGAWIGAFAALVQDHLKPFRARVFRVCRYGTLLVFVLAVVGGGLSPNPFNLLQNPLGRLAQTLLLFFVATLPPVAIALEIVIRLRNKGWFSRQ